jgi:hypothetical protein
VPKKRKIAQPEKHFQKIFDLSFLKVFFSLARKMNDPSIKSDIKFDRVNEGLIKIQDKLVRMDEMDPTYTVRI